MSFDLILSRAFVQKPEKHDALTFPLRWMFDTTKVLNFRTGLTSYSEKDEFQEKLDAIINAFTNYRIPVVTLKELSIEEVCPIFERISSSGTKLSTYDLMVTATWSQEFDLNEEASRISEALAAKGFGDIEPNTILKCLTAVKFDGIKKDQILSLRKLPKSEMDALVDKTSEALLKAVDLLSTEFRIYSWDFLPYEALVVVLCYAFSKTKNLSGDRLERIRRWFWRASFSERYRVGGENFVSRDLETIRKFVVEQNSDAAAIGAAPTEQQLKNSAFRSNNSRSRAYILALALNKPRNLTNGALIDTSEALSSYNKKQFHHIYPRAYLKRIENTNERNSLTNICMLAASENNAISDKDPQTYLPECIESLGASADTVFSSNLLPPPNEFDYENADYEGFLEERSKIVTKYITDLCDGRVH